MIDTDRFVELLGKYAKAENVQMDDVLFGEGLNISSVRFTEFLMDIEEDYNLDIDPGQLDVSIKTVGQLFQHLNTL